MGNGSSKNTTKAIEGFFVDVGSAAKSIFTGHNAIASITLLTLGTASILLALGTGGAALPLAALVDVECVGVVASAVGAADMSGMTIAVADLPAIADLCTTVGFSPVAGTFTTSDALATLGVAEHVAFAGDVIGMAANGSVTFGSSGDSGPPSEMSNAFSSCMTKMFYDPDSLAQGALDAEIAALAKNTCGVMNPNSSECSAQSIALIRQLSAMYNTGIFSPPDMSSNIPKQYDVEFQDSESQNVLYVAACIDAIVSSCPTLKDIFQTNNIVSYGFNSQTSELFSFEAFCVAFVETFNIAVTSENYARAADALERRDSCLSNLLRADFQPY
jgi:hypothetical protein